MPVDAADPRLQRVAFAHLQGEGVDVYMRKYELLLGRSSKSTPLDVVLGDNMNISRQHAKIVWNFEARHFELQVLGKNGAQVNGQLYTPSHPPQPLRSKDFLSIGDKSFHFLLPASLSGNRGGSASGAEPAAKRGRSEAMHAPGMHMASPGAAVHVPGAAMQAHGPGGTSDMPQVSVPATGRPQDSAPAAALNPHLSTTPSDPTHGIRPAGVSATGHGAADLATHAAAPTFPAPASQPGDPSTAAAAAQQSAAKPQASPLMLNLASVPGPASASQQQPGGVSALQQAMALAAQQGQQLSGLNLSQAAATAAAGGLGGAAGGNLGLQLAQLALLQQQQQHEQRQRQLLQQAQAQQHEQEEERQIKQQVQQYYALREAAAARGETVGIPTDPRVAIAVLTGKYTQSQPQQQAQGQAEPAQQQAEAARQLGGLAGHAAAPAAPVGFDMEGFMKRVGAAGVGTGGVGAGGVGGGVGGAALGLDLRPGDENQQALLLRLALAQQQQQQQQRAQQGQGFP